MAKKQIPVVIDGNDHEDISEDLIEDQIAETILQARVDNVNNVDNELNNLEPLQRQSHPLIVNNTIDICDIASNWTSNNGSLASKIHSFEESVIFEVVRKLDPDSATARFEGSINDAADVIVSYVSEKCICMPLPELT